MNGEIIDDEDPAIPCGLVAKSFFNDTYVLERVDEDIANPEVIDIKETDIAWSSDITYKFKNIEDSDVPKDKHTDGSDSS